MWRGAMRAALLAAAVGCGPDLPVPSLASVDPDWGWNGEATPVVVEGDAFYPAATARAGGELELDRAFHAWIVGDDGAHALEAVALVDWEHLSARVPAGLEVGDYDLRVETPAGVQVELPEAFRVTASPADHLEVDAAEARVPIGSTATLEVQVVDPDGAAVALPIEIVVEVVDSGTGAGTVRFEETLEYQQDLADGVGIRGWLSDGGYGLVALTSEEPDVLWLSVAPADPSSVVAGALEAITFTPGEVAAIRFELPEPEPSVEAGEEFDVGITLLDENGYRTDGASASLLLTERCGSPDDRFQRSVTFVDSMTLTGVALTGATTGGDCTANAILASGIAGGVPVTAESDDIEVRPGPVASLELSRWPDSVAAGEEDLAVLVEARDAWGNRATDAGGALHLFDSAGGLDTDAGVGEAACEDWDLGERFCRVRPVVADPSDVLTAVLDGGPTGRSEPFEVRAGTPAKLEVTVDTARVAAGGEFGVSVAARDAWGNEAEIEAVELELSDSTGTLACAWLGSGLDYSCSVTRATAEDHVLVDAPALGLSGSSAAFEVVNGDLAAAVVDVGGVTELTAGEALDVEVQATDAWGNPYVVQAVSSIEVTDDSGGLSTTLALDADGRAATTATLTRAWTDDRVRAWSGGVELGASDPFDVVAAEQSGFAVELPATWAWLDAGAEVRVRAVDDYGNTVTSYAGTVTLSSSAGLGADVTVDSFDAGEATADFSFAAAGLQDTLVADDGTYSGESDPLDVLDRTCADGPSADVLVRGAAETVLCIGSGGITPSVTIDASGSTAGAAGIVAFHLDDGTGEWSRGTSPTTTASWSEPGAWVVRAVVADADACGDAASAVAWVGDSDGEPVGPVSVSVADSSIAAGSSTSGETTVDLEATDCAGDPASGGTLVVRVDLGEVASGSSTVSASGSGLEVVLDSSGQASVTWSAASETHGGTGTFHAGVRSGAAHGAATVEITGESDPPQVVDVTPRGATAEAFDAVVVEFTEEMLTASATLSRTVLTTPSGDLADVSGLSWSEDGTELSIELASTADAGAGTWTLGLSSGLRDAAGNRLDGRYVGVASAFSIDFGDVADTAPDVTACSASVSAFHPDGDDGAGEEADSVELSVAATAAPDWWLLVVTAEDGSRVRLVREAASAATTTLEWDGRDQAGRIVDAGAYTLEVTAEDASWNRGASCTAEVAVEHRVRGPE